MRERNEQGVQHQDDNSFNREEEASLTARYLDLTSDMAIDQINLTHLRDGGAKSFRDVLR